MSTNDPSPSSLRRRTRGVRRFLVPVLVVALAGVALWWWQGRGAAAPASAEPVETTVPVALEPYRVTVAGPGSLEAARSLEATGPVGLSGTIASVVAVGDRVERGDVLARLDPAPFERAVRLAEFALERAESQLAGLEADQTDARATTRGNLAEAETRVASAEREAARTLRELELARRLHELGSESAEALRAAQDAHDEAASAAAAAREDLAGLRESQALQTTSREHDLRNAQLSVAQAELDLEEAREDLASLTVTAPFDGVVSSVEVVEGSTVSAQGALLTLIDDGTLDLPVQIDETAIGRVEVGQPALVSLDAVPGATYDGTVTAIAPVARIESNIPIFDVTVTLPNPDLSMRPGMTAEADIVVRTVEEAATVPSAAVRSGGDGASVRVRTDDGDEEVRAVAVVDTIGFDSIVEGELRDGEEVVVPGAAAGTAPGAGRGGGGFPRGPGFP